MTTSNWVTGESPTQMAGRLAATEAATPPPRRWRRRKHSIWAHVIANAAPVALIALWWWASTKTVPLTLPPPDAVAKEVVDLLIGTGARDTWTSMGRILISVLLAMFIGGCIVLMAVTLPVTELLVGNRILPFFNSIPALGWAIFGVIWFGIGDFAVIFVVTAILIPFCLVNLWEGMRALDPGLREMGRSFTRARLRVLLSIELPLLMPYLFAAARLAFSVGWKVALIAEFFGARTGLGLVMNRARQSFDTAQVFATVVVVLLIVIVVERMIFDPISNWFARKMGTAVPA